MLNHRTNCGINNILCPEWKHAQAGNTEDKSCNGNSLIPCSVVKLIELLVGNSLIKDLSNNTQDVDGRDDNRRTSNDGTCAMESVVNLK